MIKIDVHTHILPEKFPDFSKKYGYGGFVSIEHKNSCQATLLIDGKPFREIASNCWCPKTRLEECDQARVNVQLLSTVPVMFNYWAKAEDGLEIARFLNDHIADVVARHGGRFLGLGTLPLQAPDFAAKELERCMRELHLVGIQIGTHVNSWNLDDERLFPVWHAAAELGASIFVHPWDMMGKEEMPKYFLPWLVGMPAETSRAICSLIFGGILDKFPKLRFCFAHGGGAFPHTLGRIAQGFKERPDLCAVHTKRNPREYTNSFWVDSLVHDEKALRYLLDVMGEDKIVLGSDYPFPLGERIPGNLIESISELSFVTRRKLIGENALKWLNISKERLGL